MFEFKISSDSNFQLHQSASGVYFYLSKKGGYNFFEISDKDTIINHEINITWKSGDSSVEHSEAFKKRKSLVF